MVGPRKYDSSVPLGALCLKLHFYLNHLDKVSASFENCPFCLFGKDQGEALGSCGLRQPPHSLINNHPINQVADSDKIDRYLFRE